MPSIRSILKSPAFVTLTLASLTSAALAHSWYPIECCSERDCFPVAISDVSIVPAGWKLADGTLVQHHEARPSPDGKFHICRSQDGKGALIRMHSKPACFLAQVMGS